MRGQHSGGLVRARTWRARADASLAIHIVGDFPRVVATLAPDCGGPWRALEGEVVRTHLRLRNVGRARAGSLTVRTERAWLALANPLDASGNAWRVGDAVGQAPRATFRHMSAPLVAWGPLHSTQLSAMRQSAGRSAGVAPLAWPAIHDGDPEKDDFARHARATWRHRSRGSAAHAARAARRCCHHRTVTLCQHARPRPCTRIEVANVGSADMFVTDVRAAETCTVGVKILPRERVAGPPRRPRHSHERTYWHGTSCRTV